MGLKELQNIKAAANEPKPKKVYQIPRVSKKRQKKLEEQKDMIKLDHEFYEEHWRSCPHRCEQCNLNLGKEPLTIFFHHALPKRSFPQFRHTHENIIVLCGNCHSQAEVDIDKVPIVKIRTAEIEKVLNP